MALKLVTVLGLLISAPIYWRMGSGVAGMRWLFLGVILGLFCASVIDAVRFHQATRTMEAKGWRLTFLDRAISMGTMPASKLGFIPSRVDCLALPGYDPELPDIENIKKFLREHPKTK